MSAVRVTKNVALGCQCRQSSYSQWSHAGEESDAVGPGEIADFAFHTEKENNPWWEVDLTQAYPLEKITLYNRRSWFFDRIRTLQIQVSRGDEQWTTIHSGLTYFDEFDRARPFEKILQGKVLARRIRLSLSENEYFHLAKVEVHVAQEIIAFFKYCSQFNINQDILNHNNSINGYHLESYNVDAQSEIRMNGLIISYSGRLGNLFYQYINAIQLAIKTNLQIIRIGRHDLFKLEAPVTIQGLTLVPAENDQIRGTFLSGAFFNSDDFSPVLSKFLLFDQSKEKQFTEIAQKFIRPHLLTLDGFIDSKMPNEGTIHFRSGDVFDGDQPITYGYRQPPLVYYLMCIQHLMECKGVVRFRLIFEDRGNPCVGAVEQYLIDAKIEYRLQSASLRDDFCAMLDAEHLVLSHGTFGYVACRLSKSIATLYYFFPQIGGLYEGISVISEVNQISDVSGTYMKSYVYGEHFDETLGWRNTPENCQRMIDFPDRNLQLRKVK